MEGLVGRTLGGTYRIDELRGRGGMGAVYRAHDTRLHRDVAIKVMHPQLTVDASFSARFVQEARASAPLRHPGIVHIDAFAQEEGLVYIVMDYIAGQDLGAWMAQLARERKLIALEESLDIVEQVALALHYAHEKGVYHRDIKPSNILLDPTDPAVHEPGDLPFKPVLTDFGLAKFAEGGIHTQTGMTMGTPAYMSPEQCTGEEVDRRSDIYSLGVVLYQLATGRLPFELGSLSDAVRLHTLASPAPPPRSVNPTLPPEVEGVILCAMAPRQQDRYPTARALAEALRSARAHIPPGLSAIATLAEARSTPAEHVEDAPTAYVSLLTRAADQTGPLGPPGSSVWDAAPPAGPFEASIVVAAADGSTRRIVLGTQRTMTIGRSPGNEIQLPVAGVSRHHAQIAFDGQALTITDLNSTNGTFLGTSRLLPGVAQAWSPDMPVRIGQHWLRLELRGGAPDARSALATPARPARALRSVTAVLGPEVMSVEAGQRAVCQLLIHNHGVQVDHFTVGLDGIPPSWVSLPREALQLNPGESESAPLTFQPPRAPGSTAGAHPFTAIVRSQAHPSQQAQARGTLRIAPYHAITAHLAPQVIASGEARLTLGNEGNAPTQLSIAGTDPAEALAIHAAPAQLELQAGQRTQVPLHAGPRKGRPWLGATQRHPFEVAVSASPGQTVRQGGTVVVRPIIPTWVLVVLGLLSIVVCVGGGMFYSQYRRGLEATATAVAARSTAEEATAVAAATQTAGVDSDNDGLTDAEEKRLGTDPGVADTDGDGLSDGVEVQQHATDPLVVDTDHDRLPDGEEISMGANPKVRDSDGDTVEDGHEVYELGTSPINPDTDGDGVNDGADPDPGRAPTSTPPPTDTPTPTKTPPPTDVPTPTEIPAPVLQVSADPPTIDKRTQDCTTLSWQVTNARSVALDGVLVPERGQRQECPEETTRYRWTIVGLDGSEQAREVAVEVLPAVVIRHLVSQGAQPTYYYADLASNWRGNGDASVWTFYLRKAVTMADGRLFAADIVRETLDANPGVISYYGETVVIDDFTVMIELSSSNPNMILQIAEVEFVVQPCPGSFDPECHPNN